MVNGFVTVSRLYQRHTFLIYIFLCCLYHYGDWTLDQVESNLEANNKSLEELQRLFYDGYQRGFCGKPEEKVRINTHTFSHLEEI